MTPQEAAARAMEALLKLDPKPGVEISDEAFEKYGDDCRTFIILEYDTIKTALQSLQQDRAPVDVEVLKREVVTHFFGDNETFWKPENCAFREGVTETIDHLSAHGHLTQSWRPIAEAPRDGTRILVTRVPYDGDPAPMRITWHGTFVEEGRKKKGWKFGNKYQLRWEPTHFMPLPPPPAQEG